MSLGRIILKSTTKISLNDRFTVLRNEKMVSSEMGGYDTMEESRQMVQASRKNQRLAAQMERRPAVMAALKQKKNLQHRLNGQQNVSVKQRLALPGRLSVPDGFRGSYRGSRRGQPNFQVRGVGNKFLGRIRVDSRPPAFRGRGRARGRGRDFANGSQRGRGGGGAGIRGVGRGRGRGFRRGRGASRVFRRGT